MESTELTLGKYIRKLREAKRLSLLELSTITRTGYSHLSRIENESTIPSPDTIVKLAEALSGDLTVMLQKANNLPAVILERLIERDRAVKVQTLRRSMPDLPGATGALEPEDFSALEDARLTAPEVSEVREAIKGLVGLKPHARRAVVQLISVLHDDEAEGDAG